MSLSDRKKSELVCCFVNKVLLKQTVFTCLHSVCGFAVMTELKSATHITWPAKPRISAFWPVREIQT